MNESETVNWALVCLAGFLLALVVIVQHPEWFDNGDAMMMTTAGRHE